jgi:hypothetical protein
MSRQDQHQVTLVVDGRPCGVFDKRTGGGVDSTETKYRPGSMGSERSLGGSQMVPNVTITRLFDGPRDLDLVRWLYTHAGKARVSCSDQLLDADGLPYGRPDVYTGVLKKVMKADSDSNSTGAGTYDVEISTEGGIG